MVTAPGTLRGDVAWVVTRADHLSSLRPWLRDILLLLRMQDQAFVNPSAWRRTMDDSRAEEQVRLDKNAEAEVIGLAASEQRCCRRSRRVLFPAAPLQSSCRPPVTVAGRLRWAFRWAAGNTTSQETALDSEDDILLSRSSVIMMFCEGEGAGGGGGGGGGGVSRGGCG